MTAHVMSNSLVQPHVICAGILVADLFIPPLSNLPAAGELVATADFLTDSGGCAANVATALAKLDVAVGVAGKLGHDLFGDFILQDLSAKGVNTDAVSRSATYGTSKTVILPVKGQDRRYIHTFGANADFRGSDIDLTNLAEVRVFYVGGYLILPGLTAPELGAHFKRAQANGVQTVLDVVVPADDQHSSMHALEVALPHVDVFLPNDEEAARLTGVRDPEQQAKRLLQLGCKTVVITQGERGALLATTQQVQHVPAFAVEVVDPSGAGDAFAAGFIVGLLERWDISKTLRFASIIGASACTKLGCNAGIYARGDALSRL